MKLKVANTSNDNRPGMGSLFLIELMRVIGTGLKDRSPRSSNLAAYPYLILRKEIPIPRTPCSCKCQWAASTWRQPGRGFATPEPIASHLSGVGRASLSSLSTDMPLGHSSIAPSKAIWVMCKWTFNPASSPLPRVLMEKGEQQLLDFWMPKPPCNVDSIYIYTWIYKQHRIIQAPHTCHAQNQAMSLWLNLI